MIRSHSLALAILAGALLVLALERAFPQPKPLLIDAAPRARLVHADDDSGVPTCPMPRQGPLVVVPPPGGGDDDQGAGIHPSPVSDIA